MNEDLVRRKVVLNTLNRMDKALDTDRTVETYKELLEECFKVLPTVDAILKDQYVARLKADMVAMLTEIQVGIGEHINPSNHTDNYEDGWSEGAEWCIDYIQEKINALKE